MATDLIRYDLLVQEALRGVVRNVLSEAARNGLQGEHHFFITFKTNAPGLRLSNRMRERYPDEMTIILQHQFWDLGVTDHAFEVGLSFSNAPERLLVPFAAVTSFVDPSVQFGLKFDVQDGSQQASPATEPDAKLPAAEAPKALPAKRTLAAVQSAEGQDAKAAVPAAAANAKAAERKPGKPTLAKVPEKAAEPKAAEGDGTKVVSIDAFRKKP